MKDLAPIPSRELAPRLLTGRVATDWLPPAVADDATHAQVFASWVPEAAVPREHRESVRRHVDRVGAFLRLGPIHVRWFGPPVGDGDFWGIGAKGCLPVGVLPDDMDGTIAFNATLRGDLVVAVVAHEVRHLWQREQMRRLGAVPNPFFQFRREADADWFAAWWVEREFRS